MTNTTTPTLHLGTPNPKQDLFLRANCRHVAYGASDGPRGTSGMPEQVPLGDGAGAAPRGTSGMP